MRIAIAIDAMEGKGGGMGVIARESAVQLAERDGIEVMLISAGKENAVVYEENLTKVYFKSLGNEASIGILNRKNTKWLFKLLEEFKPDVVHLHDTAFICYACQYWACKNDVKNILTLHYHPSKATDFGFNEFSSGPTLMISSAVTNTFNNRIYQKADAIFLPNDSIAEDLEKFEYEGRVEIVRNARDLKRFSSSKAIGAESKRLIFIGHLSSRKNQELLVRAMQYLPQFELILVGKALNPAYQETLEKIISDLDLGNVELVGSKPHEKIPQYLAESKYFVSASQMEVQSLVVLESLASGTPVIGLSNETIDQLIDNKVGVRLASEVTPEQFADAILQFDQRAAENYSQYSQNCRDRAQDYSWGKVIPQTLDLYQQITNKKDGVSLVNLLWAGLLALGTVMGFFAFFNMKNNKRKLSQMLTPD
jgi:glycosyltransferase involved in cell wall biosynthesis